MYIERKRGKERPKKIYENVIKINMRWENAGCSEGLMWLTPKCWDRR